MALTDWILAVGTALLGSAPVAAQEADVQPAPAENSADTIVVTGTRDREKRTQAFVRALTPTSQDSIPRLIDEVCPAVVGLSPAVGEAVAARIRQVATAARMRVGRDKCVPNVLVLVRPSKQTFLKDLARRRPSYFYTTTPSEMRRLLKSPGPVAVWRHEGPVDVDGIPLRWDKALGYVNETIAPASRITMAGRRGTDSAIMFVEAGAIEGLTATQLADYAAMRLLARADPAALPSAPPPTILTLMDAQAGDAVPITLTAWDLGLLRGLGISSPELAVGSQRAQIAREVSKELDRGGTPERR